MKEFWSEGRGYLGIREGGMVIMNGEGMYRGMSITREDLSGQDLISKSASTYGSTNEIPFVWNQMLVVGYGSYI